MTYSPGALGQFATGQGSSGGSGNSYVMSAVTGSYVLTGMSVTLATNGMTTPTGDVLIAETGHYALTGNPAVFHLSHTRMTAATGYYALTGNAANMVLPFPMVLTDTVTLTAAMQSYWGAAITEFMGVGGGVAYSYVAVAGIDDTIDIEPNISTWSRYVMTQADLVKFAGAVHSALPAYIADTVTMSEVIRGVNAILVAEHLTTNDVYAVAAKYNLSIRETAQVLSSLFHFVGGEVSDGINVGASAAYTYYTYSHIVENMVLADLFGQSLIISVTCADEIELTATQLLRTIFDAQVSDKVYVDIAYIAPSGSYTTWAINTRNNNITEYQNFVFNSFTKLGNRYIAAAADGIYELLGEDDNGTPIPTIMGTGFFQPGGARYTAFKAAYLGMAMKTGAPGVFLKLITGDNSEYLYSVNPIDRATARVQFGKGLRSRYYAFELITTGGDYDLDAIEFIPLVSKRRYS